MLNLYQFLTTFEPYIEQVFKKVDEEISPEIGLVSFHLDKGKLIMSYKTHQTSFETVHQTLESLYERKSELSSFLRLLPDFDQEWNHIASTNYYLLENRIVATVTIFDRRLLAFYETLPLTAPTESKSIVDAIIKEIIKVTDDGLRHFVNGDPYNPPTPNSIIRSAGKSLFTNLLNTGTMINPFENISKIASLSYEKTFSDGKILMVRGEDIAKLSECQAFEILIEFNSAIPLSRLRHIRKILELSGKDIYLLSDGEFIYGTLRLIDFDMAINALNNLLTIEFSHIAGWQLSYNLNRLFQVSHEEIIIPRPKISYYKFSMTLRELYPEFTAKRTLQLYKLILEAFKQVKGTLIVISKNARSEAIRLKNQGFVVQSKLLTEEIMLSITRIDGAVLMDLDGVCQGIGVILDGIATEKGDPSRGARYNSAIRYVETIANNPMFADVLVVVISEDGDADIITKHTLIQMDQALAT